MTTHTVREPSCADWVERLLGRELTAFQRLAVETLVAGMNTGVYNLQVRWDRVDWDAGRGVRITLWSGGGLSTYDFDHLTRLVIAAHDNCVRVDIEAVAPKFFRIWLHPRERDGATSLSHPTIEEAIERFRGARS